MKVLVVCNKYATEDRPHLGALYRLQAHALRQIGLEVSVIGMQQSTGNRLRRGALTGSWIQEYDDEGVPATLDYGPRLFKPLSRSKRMLTWRGAQTVKRHIARHGRPDLIHAHNAMYPGLVAARIKRSMGIPFVLTEHQTAYARRKLNPARERQIADCMQECAHLLPVSDASGQVLESLFGEATKPWTPVGNMIDEDFFSLAELPRREKPVFFNVGRMQPLKGQHDLLTGFAAYLDAGGQGQLRIGGDGPLRQKLETHAGQLGISTKVDFLGMLGRERVRDELQYADAYVLSSHTETFGIPVIEALATGRPVLATRSNGPEFIMQESDGVLVPPRNAKAIADGLKSLASRLPEFDADTLRQRCIGRFGKQSLAQRLRGIYEGVLAAP